MRFKNLFLPELKWKTFKKTLKKKLPLHKKEEQSRKLFFLKALAMAVEVMAAIESSNFELQKEMNPFLASLFSSSTIQ